MVFDFHNLQSGTTSINLLGFSTFQPEEHYDILSTDEIKRVESFRSISRRREFVATRVLKSSLFGQEQIEYNEQGAPFIKGHAYISISHSHHMVGIAVNEQHMVGLDLEPFRDNILSISPKFLSEREYEVFDTNSKREVTRIWSAKEALYKLAGRKKVIFKNDLIISKDGDHWTGRIMNPDHELLVNLDIFERDETIVSVNATAVERIETHP